MPRPSLILPLAAVLVLGLSACGGDREAAQEGQSPQADPLASGGFIEEPPKAVVEAFANVDEMSQALGDMPADTTAVETRYDDGTLQAQGYMCDGKPVGPWIDWHDNGNASSKGGYVYGGVPDGHWDRWYRNGNRMRSGNFTAGTMVGKWWFWWEDGSPQMHGSFNQYGKAEGIWTTWHEGGSKSSEGYYIAGEKVGNWKHWDRRGQLINTTTYHQPLTGVPR